MRQNLLKTHAPEQGSGESKDSDRRINRGARSRYRQRRFGVGGELWTGVAVVVECGVPGVTFEFTGSCAAGALLSVLIAVLLRRRDRSHATNAMSAIKLPRPLPVKCVPNSRLNQKRMTSSQNMRTSLRKDSGRPHQGHRSRGTAGRSTAQARMWPSHPAQRDSASNQNPAPRCADAKGE